MKKFKPLTSIFRDHHFTSCREGKRLTNFYLPIQLHEALKQICETHGVKLGFQIEKLITEFVIDYQEKYLMKDGKEE